MRGSACRCERFSIHLRPIVHKQHGQQRVLHATTSIDTMRDGPDDAAGLPKAIGWRTSQATQSQALDLPTVSLQLEERHRILQNTLEQRLPPTADGAEVDTKDPRPTAEIRSPASNTRTYQTRQYAPHRKPRYSISNCDREISQHFDDRFAFVTAIAASSRSPISQQESQTMLLLCGGPLQS